MRAAASLDQPRRSAARRRRRGRRSRRRMRVVGDAVPLRIVVLGRRDPCVTPRLPEHDGRGRPEAPQAAPARHLRLHDRSAGLAQDRPLVARALW